MKTSRACTGMVPSENDDFKFLKLRKTQKARASPVPYFQGSWNCLTSANQYFVDQKHERKIAIELYYIHCIFQNIEI